MEGKLFLKLVNFSKKWKIDGKVDQKIFETSQKILINFMKSLDNLTEILGEFFVSWVKYNRYLCKNIFKFWVLFVTNFNDILEKLLENFRTNFAEILEKFYEKLDEITKTFGISWEKSVKRAR